ncbi:tetratricopeptide repeat protein [candidate division KSB1 bacterium]|nr:tetratricopeptide repeat protein [candidate division KSB1 bacterium]
MTKFFRVSCMGWMLVFALLIVLPTIAGAQGEIPLTTKSDEARKIFVEARQLSENFRLNEARELFSKAIEKDPNFALVHLYRAFTAASAMDRQKHLQHAVPLAPKVSEGERLMIEATQAQADNNPVKAVQLWEQLAQKFPNDKRAHYFLGAAYYGRDEDDKAIAEFDQAIKIDKDFAPTYNLLGYTYYQKGDYGKAEEAFKNYIRLVPSEANPYDSLADLYAKIGRHDEAITNYKKAAELNPKFAFSQRKIGSNLVFMDKYDEGREAYRKTMEMETTPSGKLADMAAIARSYVYEGKHQQALEENEKATRVGVPHVAPHEFLYRQALEENEKVLQIATKEGLPEWQAGTHSANCDIYIETGDFAKAEQSLMECRKVVTSSNLSPAIKENFAKGALFDEALIAAKRKDFTKAMAKADEYKAKIDVGKDPKEMENHHALLGRVYFEKGDYGKAIEHLGQANQENPYTLYLLAVAESKAGDKVKAAELFKKVANWNEDSLNYAFVRSKALMAMKKEIPN